LTVFTISQGENKFEYGWGWPVETKGVDELENAYQRALRQTQDFWDAFHM